MIFCQHISRKHSNLSYLKKPNFGNFWLVRFIFLSGLDVSENYHLGYITISSSMS